MVLVSALSLKKQTLGFAEEQVLEHIPSEAGERGYTDDA